MLRALKSLQIHQNTQFPICLLAHQLHPDVITNVYRMAASSGVREITKVLVINRPCPNVRNDQDLFGRAEGVSNTTKAMSVTSYEDPYPNKGERSKGFERNESPNERVFGTNSLLL